MTRAIRKLSLAVRSEEEVCVCVCVCVRGIPLMLRVRILSRTSGPVQSPRRSDFMPACGVRIASAGHRSHRLSAQLSSAHLISSQLISSHLSSAQLISSHLISSVFGFFFMFMR
ncbi:hypothetical protein PGIGA_G00136930 [Pangasianodon gigas]|uniref:Uncharacterized protein n=1 Tax=Pangasianodon gigas TaxID=30993 RepID=A0ACC5XL33_PANGG|nr:hypothetical protein [Pangasianodon gigas]